tara:strand:- start:555 stop:818 length:264 start_codon:yes stop_codon:yes gene_type:complete
MTYLVSLRVILLREFVGFLVLNCVSGCKLRFAGAASALMLRHAKIMRDFGYMREIVAQRHKCPVLSQPHCIAVQPKCGESFCLEYPL